MYTPRGVHGSADDLMPHYPMERVRPLSLAQSAREATQLNEQADREARQNRRDWIAGKHKKVDRITEE